MQCIVCNSHFLFLCVCSDCAPARCSRTASDDELAQKLWEVSCNMLGITWQWRHCVWKHHTLNSTAKHFYTCINVTVLKKSNRIAPKTILFCKWSKKAVHCMFWWEKVLLKSAWCLFLWGHILFIPVLNSEIEQSVDLVLISKTQIIINACSSTFPPNSRKNYLQHGHIWL